jgi:hypothetical protein
MLLALALALSLHAADAGTVDSKYELIAPQAPDKCKAVRAQARLQMQVQRLELKHLMQTLADLSCTTFELEKAASARISIDPDSKEPRSMTPDELLATVQSQTGEQGLVWIKVTPARYLIRRREKPAPEPVPSRSGSSQPPLPPHRHGNDVKP